MSSLKKDFTADASSLAISKDTFEKTNKDLGFTNQSGDPGIEPGDVTPDADGPAYSNVDDVIADGWFVQTDYKGAFAAGDNWLDGWGYEFPIAIEHCGAIESDETLSLIHI